MVLIAHFPDHCLLLQFHIPGLKGLNEVLKDAKFIFSNGLDSVYTKTGGFSQALKDFERVNPTKVKVKSPKAGLVRFFFFFFFFFFC